MKKLPIIALQLAVTIVLSSCNTAEDPKVETSASENNPNASVSESVSENNPSTIPSESELQTDTSDNTPVDPNTIVYGIPEDDASTMATSLEGINKRLEELGKEYRIEFLPVSERDATTLLNSPGKLDIITTSNYDATRRMAKSGLLLELTDYLSSEKGKALQESITEAMWKSLAIDGKIYGANGYFIAGLEPPCYYVNKELMNKYGLKEEDFHCSIAELEDIFEMVKKGEGEDFHPLAFQSYVPCSSMSGLESAGKSVALNLKTKKAELFIDNEDFMSIMQDVYDMNEKGYVSVASQNGIIISSENYLVSFDFKMVPLYKAEDPYESTQSHLRDESPLFTLDNLALIPWDGYERYCVRMWPATCVCTSSEKQEKALDLITTIYTDQSLSDLFIYGVEGTDYTIHENGGVVPTARFFYQYSLRYGNSMIASEYYNFSKEFYVEKQKRLLDNPFIDFKAKESLDKTADDSFDLLCEGLIAGMSYDSVVSKIRAKLEEGGANEYVDRLNKSIEEYLSGR